MSTGTIVDFNPNGGFGRVRLDDGRELPFDVDKCERGRPDVGVAVEVETGESRMGGERVVRLNVRTTKQRGKCLGVICSVYPDDKAVGIATLPEAGETPSEFSASLDLWDGGPLRIGDMVTCGTEVEVESYLQSTSVIQLKPASPDRESEHQLLELIPPAKRARILRRQEIEAATADQAGLEPELERKLSIPPGKTLIALVKLAQEISPQAPEVALAPLWFEMPWLKSNWDSVEGLCYRTPHNVLPFGETGGDLNHFGFLMDDPRLPTDERPVVMVVPKNDDEATQVVAKNLRDFLSLLTVGFGDILSRQLKDKEWFAVRKEWYGDDPDRLAEMERLSELLTTIDGVQKPKKPRKLAKAAKNKTFVLPED